MLDLVTHLDYHTDRTHLTSSSLKLLLKDPSEFKRVWVDGGGTPSSDAQDEGTLTHTLVLEPEKISEYAIFPGMRRQGKAWEEFKQANAGKKLLSMAQMLRCEKLAKAHQSMPAAVSLLKGGIVEHNLFGNIMGVPVKMRADFIVPGRYIVDLKTTSMPSDVDIFRYTIQDYGYHLSAALYCEIAKQNFENVHDFYWEVLSKDDARCEIYRAKESTLLAGSVLLQRALLTYTRCMQSGLWLPETPKASFESTEYEIREV